MILFEFPFLHLKSGLFCLWLIFLALFFIYFIWFFTKFIYCVCSLRWSMWIWAPFRRSSKKSAVWLKYGSVPCTETCIYLAYWSYISLTGALIYLEYAGVKAVWYRGHPGKYTPIILLSTTTLHVADFIYYFQTCIRIVPCVQPKPWLGSANNWNMVVDIRQASRRSILCNSFLACSLHDSLGVLHQPPSF